VWHPDHKPQQNAHILCVVTFKLTVQIATKYKLQALISGYDTNELEVKFSFVHATKAYRGRTSITPPTLNLGTRLRCVASFTPRLLYPLGKNRQYLLNRKLGGSHSQSGCFWKQVIPCPKSNLWLSSPQRSHCTGRIIPGPKLCGVISHKTTWCHIPQKYVVSHPTKLCGVTSHKTVTL
jgi:hypothetical protein